MTITTTLNHIRAHSPCRDGVDFEEAALGFVWMFERMGVG